MGISRDALKARCLWPRSGVPATGKNPDKAVKHQKWTPRKSPHAAPDTDRGCRRGVAATARSPPPIYGRARVRTVDDNGWIRISRTRHFSASKGRETVLHARPGVDDNG